ncbi:coth protein-domain-containing protein [Halteromyces radiatus]|uniref:coth protein-domain-containing protein n=1 Tax=Halteromyces radiatus TaxID=101107 RepID=UPI0022211B5B|nr:coth protein-domain-containing protein [Halteromyces radiatus]KAI8086447.1 coth protein-domain-containing protein [Halteromyces radiatus]
MRLIGFFTLSALAQITLAAHFKVIAPGGKTVQVSVNGKNTPLTAPDADVPYFIGDADAGSNSRYKYIVDGQPESFDRTLTSASTLNDIYERPVTYANIPELPTIIGQKDWTRAIEPGPIWDVNYIPSVFVNANPSDVKSLIKGLSDKIYKAKITIIDANEVHTFEGADFQLHKPGKKHNNAKQSWKWKLPQELNGRNFFKIRHMEEDPTQIREKLYADVLRAMGTYAPQANMIRFFINGQSMGTFNMLDDIPNYSYIQAVLFGGKLPEQEGPLFDGASGASFMDDEENLDAFIPAPGSTMNKDMIEHVTEDLEGLNVQDDAAVANFAKLFDVDQFLRFMVMEYLACHWDGYWQEQTNIGVYEDVSNNMLYFLGQDFDATFGVNIPYDKSFVKVPYTDYPSKFPKAVMINKLLENAKIKATFESYMKATVTKVFNNDTLTNRVLKYHEFILPDLKWDRSIEQESKGINFGWTFDQVTENLWHGVQAPNHNGGGADWGLIEYIATKSISVAQQLGVALN